MASAAVTYTCLAIVVVASLVGIFLFTRAIVRLVSLVREGAPESGRWSSPWERVWTAVRLSLSHETFKNRPVVRVAHWLVMVSFVVLFLTLIAAYGQVLSPTFVLPIVGHWAVWNWIVEILAALGFLSIVALALVRASTGMRAKRSGNPRSSRFFGSTRWQAWFVESVVALVCLAILVGHSFHYALGKATGAATATVWHYPLSAWLGNFFVFASPVTLANAIVIVAAFKIVVSMAWMAVVGLDIAMGISWHRFLAPINIAAGRSADGRKSLGALALPLVKGNPSLTLEEDIVALEEAAERAAEDGDNEDGDPAPLPTIGLGTTSDLTWKDRLDLLTCTECGRCQDVCPAWNTGKSLSPKLLTLAMRDNVVAAGGFTPPGQDNPSSSDVLGALTAAKIAVKEGVASGNAPLIPDVLASQAIWDCTMCGACVEVCPVNIEHIDHIANLRRHQVLGEGKLPRELAKPLRALETKGNPYNQSPRKRLDWAKNVDFDVPVIGEDVEDATEVDYLFWVGCAGSFDDKGKHTTAAVAELFHTAGVSYAVLGTAEGSSGDTARRAGNEVLFQAIARDNIDMFNDLGVTTIVVTCPHCYNTFANEYPDFGGRYTVLHHTQVLNRLVREKRLTPVAPPAEEARTLTYHDPCFLGRHNGIYDQPRDLLEADGTVLVEMAENRSDAMCCGAGGTRAWMEDNTGTRIANVRLEQALATGATAVATGCPFCTQMLDSALPGGADVEIKDVAVLLLEGVRRGQEGTRPHQ